MKNKNIIYFIIVSILFVVVIKQNVPSIILSNKGQYQYSGNTISDSSGIAPTKHEFELTEKSLMKFKIASVTNDFDLKVELASKDTGEKLLNIKKKNLTHAQFMDLEPGKYTFIITSFSKPTAYNYTLEIEGLSN